MADWLSAIGGAPLRKAHQTEQSGVMMLALLSVGEPNAKYCDVWITEAIVYKWQVVQVEKRTVPADSVRCTCGGSSALALAWLDGCCLWLEEVAALAYR